MLEKLLEDGSRQAGYYAQAYRFFEAGNMVAYLFSVLLLPIFSKMIKEKQVLNGIIDISFKIMFSGAIILSVLCFQFGEEILNWRYHDLSHQSVHLFSVLMFCFVCISSTYVFGTLLTANGDLRVLNLLAGSAVVVGFMKTLALRIAKINAVGVVGLVENMPGGNAQRPGDIVKSYSGKTIEVLNTDAEGRLILADALSYASKHYDPEFILDFATLTGAVVVALGHIATGIMGTNEDLIKEIKRSSKITDEKVWEFPLWQEYLDQVKSQIADVKNLGSAGQAGTIAGGAFLKSFVKEGIPWCHFDIAGTAWGDRNLSYHNKGAATGEVIRLVIDLLGI